MRRKFVLTLFLLALFCSTSTLSFAADPSEPGSWPTPNWDRHLALLSASLVDTSSESDRLLGLATHSSSSVTLRALNLLVHRSDWSLPAREATLLQFTNQLRHLTPFSVDVAVLDFLRNYRNKTLVAHEEMTGFGVPLYPIRATAQGVIHQWTRQQATFDAVELLATHQQQLTDVYAETADPNIRAGIEAALAEANPTELQTLFDYGIAKLSGKPELTGLMGKAAIELGDTHALSRVLVQGQGPKLVEIIRRAGPRFAATDLSTILLLGLDATPAGTAAILIAEWAPYTIHQHDVGAALMQRLEHEELGSTIALAMVQWGSDQQLEALMDKAVADPSSLTAKRVQTALELGRSGKRRGGRQR